jgi:hypothetical protein
MLLASAMKTPRAPQAAGEPGATPTRRRVLRAALALPAALSLGRLPGAQYGKPKDAEAPQAEPPGSPEATPLAVPADDLEAFYARWIPRARSLVREEQPRVDSFLYELCADAVRRDPSFFPKRSMTIYSGNGMKTGPVGRDDVFQLIEILLEPGTVLPAHNHVAYAFVTLCLEGEARVRHFEPEPGAPDAMQLEQDFEVREVQEVLLRPGRVSTLTRTRANVHTITAGPEGARLLDFGLKFPSRGDGPIAFSALEVDPEPTDAARGAYTARWIGNIYAKNYERKKKAE